MPRVSVVIPAYNSADYTIETVESVLAQTYRDFELIVVDDGSTDHTREALEQFGDEIRYVYKENGGACSARNLGISISTSEYVACLDCDDLWLPEKLKHSVAMLEDRPDLALSFTACYLIDGRGEEIDLARCQANLQNAYRKLLYKNYILAPTVVMRRSSLDNVGYFDERIFIPADWDLWLRLTRQFPIGYLDQPLSRYRMASNYSTRNVKQFFDESMYVLDKNLGSSPELSMRARDQIYNRLFCGFSNLSIENGKVAEAREMLIRAIQRSPYQWQAYLLFAISYLGRGFKNSSVGSRIINNLC